MADSIVLDYDPVCLTVPFGEQHERVFFSFLSRFAQKDPAILDAVGKRIPLTKMQCDPHWLWNGSLGFAG